MLKVQDMEWTVSRKRRRNQKMIAFSVEEPMRPNMAA
jgi:hypothetical protein